MKSILFVVCLGFSLSAGAMPIVQEVFSLPKTKVDTAKMSELQLKFWQMDKELEVSLEEFALKSEAERQLAQEL